MIKKTILIIIFLQLTFYPFYANACSCIQPLETKESLKEASAVFAGEVIDITSRPINSSRPLKVTFNVLRAWKGLDSRIVVLETANSSASCGYNFEKDGKYLIYANGKINDLEVSLCSRTKLLKNASSDLEDLGEGYLPLVEENNPSRIYDIILVISVIGFIIIVMVLLKQRLKDQ